MPTNLSIEPIKKRIDALKQAYENGRFADALVTALNMGNGLMQDRTFVENKDIAGNDFGKYIGTKRKVKLIKSANRTQNKRNKLVAGLELTPYQEKRARAGRQVLKKDLELTGGLRRAIETQVAEKETERSAILQFSTDEIAKISRGQEQQITNIRNGQKGTTRGSGAVKIFGLNTQEKEAVTEQGLELIKEILKI